MSGPPPTPTQLRVLSSAPSRRRGQEAERRAREPKPLLLTADTPAPSWLHGRESRAAWRSVVPLLVGMRVATIADQLAIGLLCEAMGRFLRAEAVVRKEGATYQTTTTQGSTMHRERPEVGQMERAWQHVRGLLAEFGLTPSARTRVATTDPTGTPAKPDAGGLDPFEAWQARDARGDD